MNESLTSLLMKNIDLILEAYNVDGKGNLVAVNKKKVAESDDVFHQYFVKSMNSMFRQINENDPILDPMHGGDTSMHPQGDMHGMHPLGAMPHGMGGMPADETGMMGDNLGHQQMGHHQMAGMNNNMHQMGGSDEHMGDMAMDDMHAGHPGNTGMRSSMGSSGGSGGMPSGGIGSTGGQFESTENYDWVFGENTDLDIDSLFNLTEEDDEEDEEDDDKEDLKEFMDEEHGDDADFLPGGGMDAEGGNGNFGGDMDGGMSGGMDDMGGGGMDHMDDGMGGGGMGGDSDMGGGDMMTIHGQTDNGGEFEFSFDKDALDFGGMGDENMGGDDDMSGGMGGDDQGGGDMGGEDMSGGGDQFGGGGHMGGHEPGMGHEEEDEDQPFHEAAGRKPGKGKRGPKTSRMSIVPSNPAAKHAAPFPTPQGQTQKKK